LAPVAAKFLNDSLKGFSPKVVGEVGSTLTPLCQLLIWAKAEGGVWLLAEKASKPRSKSNFGRWRLKLVMKSKINNAGKNQRKNQ